MGHSKPIKTEEADSMTDFKLAVKETRPKKLGKSRQPRLVNY